MLAPTRELAVAAQAGPPLRVVLLYPCRARSRMHASSSPPTTMQHPPPQIFEECERLYKQSHLRAVLCCGGTPIVDQVR